MKKTKKKNKSKKKNMNKSILISGIVLFVISIIVSSSAVYVYKSIVTKRNEEIKLGDVNGACGSYNSYNSRLSYLEGIVVDNAAAHNGIYRGKNITSYYTDGSLYTRISSGEFTDLYVGDYIQPGGTGTKWRIAGFDIFWGYTVIDSVVVSVHHAIIVPDSGFISGGVTMNSTATTVGGYKASTMYTTTLPNVIDTYITPVFSTHVVQVSYSTSTGMTADRKNLSIIEDGQTTGLQSFKLYANIMTEIQVTGGTIASSTFDHVGGSNNKQLPLFMLDPTKMRSSSISAYWLRNVTTQKRFSGFADTGRVFHALANNQYMVRPCFAID